MRWLISLCSGEMRNQNIMRRQDSSRASAGPANYRCGAYQGGLWSAGYGVREQSVHPSTHTHIRLHRRTYTHLCCTHKHTHLHTHTLTYAHTSTHLPIHTPIHVTNPLEHAKRNPHSHPARPTFTVHPADITTYIYIYIYILNPSMMAIAPYIPLRMCGI